MDGFASLIFIYKFFSFFLVYIVLLLCPSSFAINLLPMGFFGVIYSQKVKKKMAWQNDTNFFLKKLHKRPLYVNMNVLKEK
jgi:hypothetical protein